jgi:ubiquinone/menaquinone biosynthesis C-methylase UbiE
MMIDEQEDNIKRLYGMLRNELKATIKKASRCFSLTKKEKALKYFSSMRYQSHKTGQGHEEQSAWLSWNRFDNMEKAWRVNHRSHFVIIEWLKKEIAGNPFSMLDCGILSGVTYRKLREGNFTVTYTGIDIAPQIVADCRKRYPEADWRVMDVQQMTLPSNSRDVVLIRHVLEHLPYYDKAIKEAKRVSKKYALFCLFFPLGDRDELREKSKKGGKYHFNTYGRSGFERLLKGEFSEVQEVYIEDPQRDNQLFICRI